MYRCPIRFGVIITAVLKGLKWQVNLGRTIFDLGKDLGAWPRCEMRSLKQTAFASRDVVVPQSQLLHTCHNHKINAAFLVYCTTWGKNARFH